MDAVRKAASGAVDSIRNSPLFKRKFGTRSTPNTSPSTAQRQPGAISPEKDTTPFIQGIYFHVSSYIIVSHSSLGVYLVILSFVG